MPDVACEAQNQSGDLSSRVSAPAQAGRRVTRELTDEVLELVAGRLSAVVLATIGEDGFPLTTIAAHVVARDSLTLAVALPRDHPAVANLRKEPRVAVAVAEEGDVAACVRGRAEIERDAMSAAPWMSLVTVAVADVRHDPLPDRIVCQGIRTRQRGAAVDLTGRKIACELKARVQGPGSSGRAV